MTLIAQEIAWHSGQHVGANKPVVKGYIRRGHLSRHYDTAPNNEVFSQTPGVGGPNSIWYAKWEADEDFMPIPNILSAKGDADLADQKGVEQVTMEIDNIVLAEQTGLSGLFHELDRGHMSPLRGSAQFNDTVVGGAENDWENMWKDEAAQVVLLMGYGEAFFPVFCGLVDDCDLSAKPDRLAITMRNMGKTLTDQHVFMDAKNLWVRDPITFCDRRQAFQLEDVSLDVRAKSNDGSHPARFAIDDDVETAWVSERHDDDKELEWIEVTISNARLEQLEVFPGGQGMEMYFSVFATNENVPGKGNARQTNGDVVGEGWINEGLGHVPGTEIPFTRKIGTAKEKAVTYAVKDEGGYLVGDNSKVRIWFRNLLDRGAGKVAEGSGPIPGKYQAAVRQVKVFDSKRKEEALKNHWILVDDVSDIVKTVLQWAGFRADGVHAEWEIETVGVRLKDKLVFDRQSFLIDIIWKLCELTSYVFFVKPPTSFDEAHLDVDHNLSTGVAVFRQNSAMRTNPPDTRYFVRDQDLLEQVQPHFSNESLADSVRVRGTTVAKAKKRRNPNVHPLGADRTRRFQYSYRPVWARPGRHRFGHIRKPVVHYDEQVDSVFEAKIGCLLIALRESLEANQLSADLRFFPPIYLDQQLLVHDSAAAIHSRIWIAQRSWEYRGGANAAFDMTVSGALLDVPDVSGTVGELSKLLNQAGYDPAPIARGPWTEVHEF